MGVKSRAGKFRDGRFTTDITSYVHCYRGYRPPLMELVERLNEGGDFPTTGERALHILAVGSALYQDVSEKILADTVENMRLSLGEAFYRPHDLPFSELEKKVAESYGGYSWELLPKVPGILRSLQDFSKMVGGWKAWLDSSSTGEALVRGLCADVFYMGKRSEHPFKARYLVTLLTDVFPEKTSEWLREFCFPLSRGAVRCLRDMGRLSEKNFDKGVATRVLGELFGQSGLKRPLVFYCAMAGYRQRMALQWYRCQEALGGCENCPLDTACPK